MRRRGEAPDGISIGCFLPRQTVPPAQLPQSVPDALFQNCLAATRAAIWARQAAKAVELGSRTVSPAPASSWDSRIKECLAEETGAAVEAVKLKGATPAVEAVKLKGATPAIEAVKHKGATPMDLSAVIGAAKWTARGGWHAAKTSKNKRPAQRASAAAGGPMQPPAPAQHNSFACLQCDGADDSDHGAASTLCCLLKNSTALCPVRVAPPAETWNGHECIEAL